MRYFKIVNWTKFQHYKHRRPPWIKLYSGLLRKPEFVCLQDASKLLAVLLWLYASTLDEDDPRLPADENYLKQILPIRSKVELQPLVDAGFITLLADCKQDASKMLARCLPTELQSNRDTEEGKVTEHCNPESETKERKKRKKRRVTQHAIVDPPGPPGEKGENQSCTFVSDSFRNSELGRQKLLLALTEQLVPRKRADATLARNVIRHIAGNGHPAGIERDLLAAAAACRGADNPWAMFASRVQAAPFGYRPAGRRSGT